MPSFNLGIVASAYHLPLTVQYLVVAGGGPGGNDGNYTGLSGGGGGAGGLLSGSFSPMLSTNYTVTIGAGGSVLGNRGNSSIFGPFTSIGGGAGQSLSGITTGGSGGGAWNGGTGADGTAGQGNKGGNATANAAGGGGGAGAVGNNASGGAAGSGGAGITSTITGSSVAYAGGGGGAGGNYYNGVSGSGGSGGSGGGGSGGAAGGFGTNGTLNTGGGGGGSSYFTAGYTYGGSGVVILRYHASFTITVGAGLTSTTSTVGSDKVTRFTLGTGNVSWS